MCLKCDKKSLRNKDLCKRHWIEMKEEEYLDNSDIHNLGIVKWAKDMLPEYMKNTTPEFHMLFYYAFLSLYNPLYTSKWERLLQVISWRESAKSTVLTMIFPSYILAHNGKMMKLSVPYYENGEEKYRVIECKIQEGFIVIVSETGPMAEDFTVRIRDEFTINPMLKYFYSVKIQNAYDAVDGQWTRKAFKFNNCFVLGIGQGMQARGRIKGANRITLLIADDIYSENNTLTVESRAKVNKWWNKAIKNSVDNVVGKVVSAGTIVHEDTVIVTLQNNPMWKTIKIALMPLKLFEEFRKTYIREDRDKQQCFLPYDDIKIEVERIQRQKEFFKKAQEENDWQLSWANRVGLYEIALAFKENYYAGTIDTYYQEMFHIVNPDDEKRFTKDMFHPSGEFDYQSRYGYNWIRWTKFYLDWKNVNIQFGVDMSAGTLSGDNGVIDITARFSNGKFLKIKQIIGKMPMRDILYNQKTENTVEMDRTNIVRVGWMDEIYRQIQFYHPECVKIGVAGEETGAVDELRRLFLLWNETTIIQKRKQQQREGKKEERIWNNMLPSYEAHMVYHAEGLWLLEHELEFLGKGSSDDCADAGECGMHGLTIPQELNMQDVVPQESTQSTRRYVFERHLPKKERSDWRTR